MTKASQISGVRKDEFTNRARTSALCGGKVNSCITQNTSITLYTQRNSTWIVAGVSLVHGWMSFQKSLALSEILGEIYSPRTLRSLELKA